MLNNQVEVLLKKQVLYREVDALLLNLSSIYASHRRILQFTDLCIAFERDKAVSSMRFLCVFYDMPSEVFFLSATLFDSLLENNQVSSLMFDVLHISCFYVSAISSGHLIQFEDIIKFSSCTGNVDLMYSTAHFILTKLQASIETIPTILSLLKLFLAILLLQTDDYFNVIPLVTTKLEVLISCHKFSLYRVDELVLALCHNVLKQTHPFDDGSINAGILELIKKYQMDERQFCLCLREVELHLYAYDNQKNINPRLKLSWTISKKLLMKMKPSTRFPSKLEPLMENPDDLSKISDQEEHSPCKDSSKLMDVDQTCVEISRKEVNSTFQYKLMSMDPAVLHKLVLADKFRICPPVS